MHSGEKNRYRYSDSRSKEKAGVLGRQLQSRPPSAAVMHARSKVWSEVRGPSAQKPCQLGPAETRARYGWADFEETWFSLETLGCPSPHLRFSLLFFLSLCFLPIFLPRLLGCAHARRSFASSFNSNLLSNSWSARDNAPMQIKIKKSRKSEELRCANNYAWKVQATVFKKLLLMGTSYHRRSSMFNVIYLSWIFVKTSDW